MKRKLIAEFKAWWPKLDAEQELDFYQVELTRKAARQVLHSNRQYFPTAKLIRVTVQIFEDGK